jgi:hypothetical protein
MIKTFIVRDISTPTFSVPESVSLSAVKLPDAEPSNCKAAANVHCGHPSNAILKKFKN